MEKYIQKINDKILKNDNLVHAKKVKKIYQLIGGLLIAVGLAGFLASFISFLVLFFKFETDTAFTAWIVAVPFLLMIIAGAVVARIGDALLPQSKVQPSTDTKLAKSDESQTNTDQTEN